MTELAEVEEEDGLLSRTFAPVFEIALADLLAREPAARSRLRSVALNAPLAVRRSMACALGLLDPQVALEELTALLGFDADLDPTLLAQIARVGGRSPKPVEERLVWPVRAGLSADSPRCVAAAATALGALEDLDALDGLLHLLRHPDGAVRQSSHRALQAIAGVRLPAQPERWELWVSEERAWYEERSPDLGAELASSNRLTLAQALGEIVVHPLYRRDLCFDVAALLRRPEPGVRSLACQILAQLGVVETVPELIPALEDESEGVAHEAWKALRAITGKDLSPEPDAWWAWHAGEGTDPDLEELVGGWIKAPQGSRR